MENSIVIDSREQKRIESATKYYKELGYDVTVSTLDTGDYLFHDKVVFEYKTWSDYINSILDGRLFNEAINQSDTYPYHFVMIHGNNYTLREALKEHDNMTMKHIQGSIARLNTYTTVIQSTGGLESCFYMMHVQAQKCIDNKGKVKSFDAKTGNSAYNLLCYCFTGISDVRATNIVEQLGLEFWGDVYSISKERLLTVDGIGENIADDIMRQVKRNKGNTLEAYL